MIANGRHQVMAWKTLASNKKRWLVGVYFFFNQEINPIVLAELLYFFSFLFFFSEIINPDWPMSVSFSIYHFELGAHKPW